MTNEELQEHVKQKDLICDEYIEKIERDLRQLLDYYYDEMKEKEYSFDVSMKSIYCALLSLLMSHIFVLSSLLDGNKSTLEDFISSVKKDIGNHLDGIKSKSVVNLSTIFA